MIKQLQIVIYPILFLSFYIVSSQDTLYETKTIGIKEGLNSHNTYDILKDKNKFIWTGTIGGLVRYDGFNFKSYNASFFGINENASLQLALDQKNQIWFCERKAYTKTLQSGVLNTYTDSIYNFETISKGLFTSKEVVSLNPSKHRDNLIFITTVKGIVYKYDGEFEEIYTIPNFNFPSVICEVDGDGNYWITYRNNKISKIDNNGSVLETYNLKEKHIFIKSILKTEPYVVFESYNAKLERAYWQIENYVLKPLEVNQNNDFQLLSIDSTEKIFFENDTIFKEIFWKNSKRAKRIPLTQIPNLTYNSYFKDNDGIMWITSNNGLHKIIARKNHFLTYQKNNSIRGILKDADDFWVGGYTQSVFQNLKTRKNTYYKLPIETATHFIKDDKNNLWIGSISNKLFKLDSKDSTWHQYKLTPFKALQVPYINPVTKTLWIGTDSGLTYLAEAYAIKIYQNYPELSDAHIRQFLKTSEGIWIVTTKGLFLMDPISETILSHYSKSNGFPTNNINHIYKDKEGVFWLATKTNGLVRWEIKDNKFKIFSTQDGLSNNTLYAVYEDDYNNLWLPSNYGLMRFDKTTNDTQVFTVENGIADNEFNTFAHFKAEDGTLYFGGINGVTSFHPKDFIEQDLSENPLYLTCLKILKKGNEEFQEVPVNLTVSKPILLDYDDQIFRFEFSLLDFKSMNRNQYAYKIEEFHEQWIYTRDNEISVFNFPYGNHTIRVKAKGDSNLWSTNELQIPIFVNKPFYLKWQFTLLTLGILALGTYLFFRQRFKRLQDSKIKLETEVKSRTQQIEEDKQTIKLQAEELKALDLAKGRFFTNLTHEFRTPLTLIVGPLEQIIDNPPPAAILKRRATGILNNTKHILGLINQLLDLTKLESKQMPIELVNVDIVAHTKELVNRFQSLATQNEQQLTFKSNKAIWETNFDIDKWDKISYNLISNALKFTPKNGQINVVLNQVETNSIVAIELLVIDSGVGIEEKNKEAIFNRFYQVDLFSTRANDGTGIGLALVRELVELQGGNISVTSKINEGTIFRVLLPISADAIITAYISNRQNEFLIPAVKYEERLIPTEDESTEKLDILVVEDNEDIRDYIVQCLGQKVYTIVAAKDGEEGLEKALSLIPDLIISDVMMPKKDGFELVESLRNHISTSHIPIILLTAKATMDSKLQGLKRGADDYLTKPFNPKELSIRVKNLIDLRQRLQNRYDQNKLSVDKAFETEDAFILQLKKYIQENLQQTDLNGDTIGQHFGLSRIHLYRKLKALTNMSISEFVKKIRLERGLELVSQKQLNISEIAYETGFSSPSHFSRSFKDKYGKSPSQL